MLSDFLKENGISAEEVTARSKALETLSSKDRAMRTKRITARRVKKPYAEAGAEKPKSLGRGVSARTLKAALEGQSIARLGRKKIARAVSSILRSKGQDEVEWRKLFMDVPSKKGKKAK